MVIDMLNKIQQYNIQTDILEKELQDYLKDESIPLDERKLIQIN